jgi:Family of unknown function (DUF5681)
MPIKRETVGYGQPPRQTQFRKGRSGNPKGRPKGSRSLATLMGNALNEAVVINENGRRRTITKGEALIKQLVNRGAAGDARSIQLLLAQIRVIEADLESPVADGGKPEGDTQLLMYERLTIEERRQLRDLVAKAQGDPAPVETADGETAAAPVATNGGTSSDA